MSETYPQRQTRELAERYDNTPDELDLIGEAELNVLKKLIEHQYNHIISNGFDFWFFNYEPYGQNPKIADVIKDFNKGWIDIHTTGNHSPVWGAYTNLQFRAIHDFIHCGISAEFDHESEKKVLAAQLDFAKKISGARFAYANWELYYKILRSEIVYQSAYKEAYGTFHIEQKIILTDL